MACARAAGSGTVGRRTDERGVGRGRPQSQTQVLGGCEVRRAGPGRLPGRARRAAGRERSCERGRGGEDAKGSVVPAKTSGVGMSYVRARRGTMARPARGWYGGRRRRWSVADGQWEGYETKARVSEASEGDCVFHLISALKLR